MVSTGVESGTPAGGQDVGPTDVDEGAAAVPDWYRRALLALLAGTTVLYVAGLGSSGYANAFYAAAVQAGTTSWKAMFFGSLDGANAITVDKPAAFLWPMQISGRIFGFSSWSMLLPQALEGVAAVALSVATVRRMAGAGAGIAAGVLLALTPVAALMFRFNNPDAMLVLVLVAAGYATVRALESGSTRWLVSAGVLVGLGFITKMGQALLVVPGLGLAYLVAAPTRLRRRLAQLALAGLGIVVGAGWWLGAVALTPASARPYVGGSTDDSELGLAFGYNGLGRILGRGSGGGGGGAAPGGADVRDLAERAGGFGAGARGGFGGAPGVTRLFHAPMATEISWLLPAALIMGVAGLWLTRRTPRTDLTRAGLMLFGGWLLVTAAVLSFMKGNAHSYYTIELAPAIAGLIAIGLHAARCRRDTAADRAFGATAITLAVVATVAWDVHLLAGTTSFLPWLRPAMTAAVVAAGLAMLGARLGLRRVTTLGVGVACAAALAGPAAYAVDTAATPHGGGMVASGPARSEPQGRGAFAGFRGAGADACPRAPGDLQDRPGGPDGAANVDPALTALLRSATTRWAAATVSSMRAAPLQLAARRPVMALGGFTGQDPSPTLAQFQTLVADGRIHYLVSSGRPAAGPGSCGPGGFGGFGGRDDRGTGAAIVTWVTQHFTATTVGPDTVYDLTVSGG